MAVLLLGLFIRRKSWGGGDRGETERLGRQGDWEAGRGGKEGLDRRTITMQIRSNVINFRAIILKG